MRKFGNSIRTDNRVKCSLLLLRVSSIIERVLVCRTFIPCVLRFRPRSQRRRWGTTGELFTGDICGQRGTQTQGRDSNRRHWRDPESNRETLLSQDFYGDGRRYDGGPGVLPGVWSVVRDRFGRLRAGTRTSKVHVAPRSPTGLRRPGRRAP